MLYLSSKEKRAVAVNAKCGAIIFLLSVIGLLAATPPAGAAGFLVKPMNMEFSPRAGEEVSRDLELHNLLPERVQVIDVALLELTQMPEGGWFTLEPGAAGAPAGLSSCVDWLTLSADNAAVQPMSSARITLTLKTPAKARGFYGAALIAKTRPAPDAIGVATIIRFLIPILVNVQGRSVKQHVELSDTGLTFREASASLPAASQAAMTLTNTGQTMSVVSGRSDVFRYSAESWQRICTIKHEPIKIIPGLTVTRKTDLDRKIPPGRYRMETSAYVDGRRVRPFTKEFDYGGDPGVTTVAADVAFMLESSQIEIEGASGARRRVYVTLQNPTDMPLDVSCEIVQPPALTGVAMGDIKGDDYSCHGWARISPPAFRLRGGGNRRISVQAAYPKTVTVKPYHYALLRITAAYADGRTAGATETLILAHDKKGATMARMHGMGITLGHAGGSRYAVTAKFGNTGNIHLTPTCEGSVTDTTEMKLIKPFELSREYGLVLPLGMPVFGGEIDFTDVAPGTYHLRAIAKYTDGQRQQTLVVRVSDGADGKVVEVVKPEAQAQ